MATRGIFAAILRSGESGAPEILLIQRSGKRDGTGYPGQWELPGGRTMEGETDEQCVAREALEETGLLIRSLGAVSPEFTAPPGTVTAQSDDAIVHLCEVDGGNLKLFPTGDHLAAGWIGVSDLFSGRIKVLTNPTSKGYISRMMNMILAGFKAYQAR